MGRFSGKKVLITGGTSGIGFSGALRIVAEGGQVAVTGMDEARLKSAREALPKCSLIIRSDSAEESDSDLLREKIEGWGKLDGLWLNAGYAELGRPEDVTAEAFNRMMNANVRGPMLQLSVRWNSPLGQLQ